MLHIVRRALPLAFPAPGKAPRRMRRGLLALAAALLAPLASAADSTLPDPDPARRGAALDVLVARHASAPTSQKLRAVNRFYNAVAYRGDRAQWGQDDFWTTPEELLGRGAGDCEDLAIGKYFALRRLGVPESALRITYARDVLRRRAHMVLVYRDEGGNVLVLDSRDDRLLPAAERPELVAIYGFNESRVTVAAPGGVERSFPHAGRWRIRRWEGVLRRIEAARRARAGTALLARASSSP